MLEKSHESQMQNQFKTYAREQTQFVHKYLLSRSNMVINKVLKYNQKNLEILKCFSHELSVDTSFNLSRTDHHRSEKV